MNLAASMSLENRGFLNPLRGAQSALGGLKSTLMSLTGPLAALGVGFGAFKSVEGIVDGFRNVFETGKELKAISTTTGQSIRDTVILRKAYSELGMEAGSLPGDLARLQASLGGVNEEGVPTKAVFEQIGLSIEGLKGKTAVQQITEIGKAISSLATQEDKMAAVRGIFGRGGAPMLNIFGNPEAIANAASLVGKQADIYQRSAIAFAEIQNKFEAVGNKVKGIFVGLAEYVQPALIPILDAIKGIDTVGISQRAGKSISDALQLLKAAFDTGRLIELLKLSVIVGFESAVPTIKKVLTDAFTSTVKFLKDGISGAMQELNPARNVKRDSINDFYDQKREALSKQYSEVDDRAAGNKYHGQGDKAILASLRNQMDAVEKERQSVLKREGFAAPSIEGTNEAVLSESGRALNALVSDLRSTFKPLQMPTDQPAQAGTNYQRNVKDYPAGGGKGGGMPDTDRLSKIGLFVGGSGPANDYARRTADNTAAILQALKNSKPMPDYTPPVGVWA